MDTSAEVFSLPERVLVSPSGGRVELVTDETRAEGEFVLTGDSIAAIRRGDGEQIPVRSAFPGWVMGYLVLDGQPIDPGDPVAWLRVE
ncbi:MAG: hypothetical protein ABR600_11995 [Actinomycetota bacterium]